MSISKRSSRTAFEAIQKIASTTSSQGTSITEANLNKMVNQIYDQMNMAMYSPLGSVTGSIVNLSGTTWQGGIDVRKEESAEKPKVSLYDWLKDNSRVK